MNHSLREVTDIISNKWNVVKTVVSLTTPRTDSKMNRSNCKILHGIGKREFMQKRYVSVSDNNNLWFGYCLLNQILKEKDGFHLTNTGVSLLISNIRKAMHSVFVIKANPKLKFKKKD